jgi:3-oxoacyl-[acyl-carrier protein] reductase
MGKTLLVVGASSDMGIATIEKIKDNYDCVIAHYLHMNDKLHDLANRMGDKMVCIKADLSETEEINSFVTYIQQIERFPDHIVHFPAQQIKIQKFQKTGWSVFQKGWDISVKSLVLILQAFLPKMAKARDGKVLVMLSYVVDGMPPKYSVDYVMTKYTLLGLVKSLAVEYADKGITVNGISPAFTETRFVDGMLDYFKEENKKSSPIGRNLKVEDVIPTIEYMLSSGADCINGQNILITCGR